MALKILSSIGQRSVASGWLISLISLISLITFTIGSVTELLSIAVSHKIHTKYHIHLVQQCKGHNDAGEARHHSLRKKKKNDPTLEQ